MKQREGKVRSYVDISADMYPSLNWDKGSAVARSFSALCPQASSAFCLL
jgi:hypothetical protein